jgi:hypothetical protein
MWWNEFFWVIGDRMRKNDLTKKQATLVEELRKQFPDIEEGRLFIPGEESDPEMDFAVVKWAQYRKYDAVDRIQLILPVIKALATIK